MVASTLVRTTCENAVFTAACGLLVDSVVQARTLDWNPRGAFLCARCQSST